MAMAGGDLANLIRTQIVANGATRVVAMTLPDPGYTADYAGLPAQTRALMTQDGQPYSAALLAGLAGTSVKVIDMAPWFADVVTRPAACDPAKMPPAVEGSALICNAAPAALFTAAGLPNLNSLRTGASVSTWFWSDGVHPSSGGHKAIADLVWSKLQEYG